MTQQTAPISDETQSRARLRALTRYACVLLAVENPQAGHTQVRQIRLFPYETDYLQTEKTPGARTDTQDIANPRHQEQPEAYLSRVDQYEQCDAKNDAHHLMVVAMEG